MMLNQTPAQTARAPFADALHSVGQHLPDFERSGSETGMFVLNGTEVRIKIEPRDCLTFCTQVFTTPQSAWDLLTKQGLLLSPGKFVRFRDGWAVSVEMPTFARETVWGGMAAAACCALSEGQSILTGAPIAPVSWSSPTEMSSSEADRRTEEIVRGLGGSLTRREDGSRVIAYEVPPFLHRIHFVLHPAAQVLAMNLRSDPMTLAMDQSVEAVSQFLSGANERVCLARFSILALGTDRYAPLVQGIVPLSLLTGDRCRVIAGALLAGASCIRRESAALAVPAIAESYLRCRQRRCEFRNQ